MVSALYMMDVSSALIVHRNMQDTQTMYALGNSTSVTYLVQTFLLEDF